MKSFTETKPAQKSNYDFVKNHICYQGKVMNKRIPAKSKKAKTEKNKSKNKQDEEFMINTISPYEKMLPGSTPFIIYFQKLLI